MLRLDGATAVGHRQRLVDEPFGKASKEFEEKARFIRHFSTASSLSGLPASQFFVIVELPSRYYGTSYIQMNQDKICLTRTSPTKEPQDDTDMSIMSVSS